MECTLCSIGRATFSNSKGLTKCESCLPGTFSDSKGLAKCKNCLPGTYSDLDGSEICKTPAPISKQEQKKKDVLKMFDDPHFPFIL